ncbi:MAG: flagellar biosynthetic protein FliO [Vibrionaceae bacterium]
MKLLQPLIFCSLFFSVFSANAAPLTAQDNMTTVLVLLSVIALIFAIAHWVKRMNLSPLSGKAGVKLISQLALGQKERIMVIDVNGEQMVIGITAHNINLLKVLDTPITPAVSESANDESRHKEANKDEAGTASFAQKLAQVIKKDSDH